jgi:propionyl-CoA carboxylase alpha chain
VFRSGDFDTHFVKTQYAPEMVKQQQARDMEVAALVAFHSYLEEQKIVQLPKN